MKEDQYFGERDINYNYEGNKERGGIVISKITSSYVIKHHNMEAKLYGDV